MIYDDDINKNNSSADDVLENTRNSQPKSIQVKLAEDNEPPAAPAKKPGSSLSPKAHPMRDARPDASEVYEESEEGVAYTPNNPGSEQQMKEAEKIIRKETRDEQA